MKVDEIFATITASITAKLEQGVRPWAQPWTSNPGVMSLPHSIVSGKAYRGANVFWLWMAQGAAGYPTAEWLTYKQAEALGGNVMKGQKGTPAVYWAVKKGENKKGDETRTLLPCGFTLFNVAQCENLPVREVAEPVPEGERLAVAEALIAATGAKMQHGGDRAFYVPSRDYIQLPAFADFRSPDDYYGTAFHELGHWTGHESRLNRTFGQRFGDDAYAFEELVAELTAAYVCGSQGFASVERDDHAAYLANWIRVLRNDPKAFKDAAAAAQKAADVILKTGYGAQAATPPQEAEPQAAALAMAA